MACLLTEGRKEPCKDAVGGLKFMDIFNFSDTAIEVAGGLVTDINDGAEVPGPATGYRYELKGVNNFEETINTSRDTGTTFFSQMLNAQLKKMEQEWYQDQYKTLAVGRFIIVVVDNNNNVYCMGAVRGAELSGGTAQSGTALGDLNGYTLPFMAEEPDPAFFLTGATPADPYAGMTTPPTIVEGTNT